MSLTLADYHYTGCKLHGIRVIERPLSYVPEANKGTAEEQDRHFENCTAYAAELSEIGFSFYRESMAWNYSHLT